MTGAENLMNTVINSLSMIDQGFTVTLTVTPHNWDVDCDENYDEEDEEDDEPHVSEEVIEEIKDFARRCGDVKRIADADNVFELYRAICSMGDNLDDLHKYDDKSQRIRDVLNYPPFTWPKAGDEVWYKTKLGNHERGKAKVVCHNTIQLDSNVTLERKDCKRVPFEVGDDVYFYWLGRIKHGVVKEHCSDKEARVETAGRVYCIMYESMFSSVDELLDYIKFTADE